MVTDGLFGEVNSLLILLTIMSRKDEFLLKRFIFGESFSCLVCRNS